MSERAPMDTFLAVFNGHVNGADRRAREFMRRRCPKYLEAVEEREREGGGIMAIFDYPHRAAFKRYASLVQGQAGRGTGD